jgi:hypothetical protein
LGVADASNTPTRSEGEESVSLDPAHPLWAIVGANEGSQGGGANGLNETPAWWSHDGGCTWHPVFPDLGGLNLGSVLPLGPQAPEFKEVGNVLTADQDSAWDTHGNAYFSDIQVSGLQGGDTQIRVAHSVDGGMTWGSPVVAFSSQHSPTPVGTAYALGQIPLDRPWLAVDRSGGPRDGSVYVTWETSPFTPGLPPEVFAAASSDHGQTWSRAVRVDDGTYKTQFNPRQFPAVGPDGTLYDVYDLAGPTTTVVPGAQGGTIELGIGVSTDGAQSFSRYIVDPNVHRVTDPDEATPEYSETISGLAADPRRAGTVAVAWPEAMSADNSRIELRVSVNGGRSWGPRVDVADDPASRNDQHDHAAVSFGPDGKLYVEWRDRRLSDGTWSGAYDVWVRQVTVSASGATTLGPVVRMTASSQPATTISSSSRGSTLSEFYGVATAPGVVAAAWDQVVGSLTDAVFHRVPVSAFQTTAARHRTVRHRRHRRTHRRRSPSQRARVRVGFTG